MTLKTIIENIRATALGIDGINEVSFGDANQLDLSTITSYPLLHISPVSIEHSGAISTVSLQLTLVAQADDETEASRIDAVSSANLLMSTLLNSLYQSSTLQLPAATSTDVVYDQFANRLYGFTSLVAVLTERDLLC